MQVAFASLQPITGLVKRELTEMEFLGRTSPRIRWRNCVENDAPSAANKQLLQQLRGSSKLYLPFIKAALPDVATPLKTALHYSDFGGL